MAAVLLLQAAREAAAASCALGVPVLVSLGVLEPTTAHGYVSRALTFLGADGEDQGHFEALALRVDASGGVPPASSLQTFAAFFVVSALLLKVMKRVSHIRARRAAAGHFEDRRAKREESFAREAETFRVVVPDQEKLKLQVTDIKDLHKELVACAQGGVNFPFAKRRQQLLALQKMLKAEKGALMKALKKDLGKPDWEAMAYEFALVENELNTMLDNMEDWAAPHAVPLDFVSVPSTGYSYREPLGVVLVIGTWNFPLQLTLVPIIGAVACGNVVCLKPSNVAPTVARELSRCISQYMDPQVVSCVGADIRGDRTTTGELLNYKWDHVFFTGSPSVGKVVYEGAARHLSPVTLELGGKNPVFVDKSANVKLAAKRIVWARMINAGQQCIAPDTVLCHKDVREDFDRHCKEWVAHFYQGDQSKENGRFGKIVGQSQFDRVVSMLDQHNGEIICGGEHDRDSLWIAPTIIGLPGFGNEVLDEETFGPILWVVTVGDMEEAIEYQQHREKPLSCYIFSRDQHVTDSILYAVPAGGVTVNSCLWHAGHHHLPFGGVGSSGLGSYHGEKSFEIFSHNKPVLHKWAFGTWDFAFSDPFILYPVCYFLCFLLLQCNRSLTPFILLFFFETAVVCRCSCGVGNAHVHQLYALAWPEAPRSGALKLDYN
jgi:aldehyde dehydrogenase (NAD+)